MTDIFLIYIFFMTSFLFLASANASNFDLPPAPVAAGTPYFFASTRACATSGSFSAEQCAEAFDRVDALMRDRAPSFPDRVDCVLRFKLCEKAGDAYRPQVLGVEIELSAKGLTYVPMLAVDAPSDLWRDQASPPPVEAGVAPAPRGERKAAVSPYGLLSLAPAKLAPPQPSLAGYRRFVGEVQLRLAVLERGAAAIPEWRSRR
jgi:hypothetical protein